MIVKFRNDNNSKSKHSLSSSSNSRHAYSQRHHPYSSSNSRFTFSSPINDDETIPNIVSEKARSVICQPLTGLAIVSLTQVFECSGIYKKQNLPGTTATNYEQTASISHCKQPTSSNLASKVPSRFASMSANQRYVYISLLFYYSKLTHLLKR